MPAASHRMLRRAGSRLHGANARRAQRLADNILEQSFKCLQTDAINLVQICVVPNRLEHRHVGPSLVRQLTGEVRPLTIGSGGSAWRQEMADSATVRSREWGQSVTVWQECTCFFEARIRVASALTQRTCTLSMWFPRS